MDLETNSNDPYYREDPGPDLQRISACKFDLDKEIHTWKSWRTNDGRILPNINSSFELVDNPFDTGSLVLLTANFDPSVAGKSFGGFGIRAPVKPALNLSDQTFVEFDLYYPKTAAGKYMRFEIWSTSSGGEGSQGNTGSPGEAKSQLYIRTEDLDNIGNLNPDWIGFYKSETWYRKAVRAAAPVSTGTWDYLNIDLHTETGTKVDGGLLMLGNIRITQPEPGEPIPNVLNEKSFSEVTPLKEKYNPDNGYFLIGTVGTGKVEPDTIKGHHYQIFVDEDNLKPECHLRPPQWLRDESPGFTFHFEGEGQEWDFPTKNYLDLRDSGKPGEYKIHGHCMAWISQSPIWMRQLLPETITSMDWNKDGLFYTGGNNAAGPYKRVKKDSARRLYFEHILSIMRHFMSTDKRYGSSVERGIIPFHSYDILNIEIHEGRYNILIQENPNEWKKALKHVSWLMAMTDSDLNDLRQHYVYLLFKYAHIAVPNAQMAEKYKTHYNNPDIVPEYMKLDNHDHDGSIDAYINDKPPLLVFNEYVVANYSKARVACNMIRELNALWKEDPLYDGRNLIECMGIQGHETVAPDLADHSQRIMSMFAGLINEGLLDKICYSEIDMRLPDSSPGGGARAPDVLNRKQADVIGYQYALLFKIFEKYKKYIDHVIFWSQYGSSWMNSYVPFDHEQKACQIYYGIMDPDRFIQGHSYLDSYFAGEYEKVK
ncbi:MAG: endo-1,4-beta-xylanase [Treponema sp.]|jgi:GH35 family endo-1,4-beta-xylanase|nr:endo-1,4-beta-xylanase [Treponema sp.]